ncbi:hypothetical protein [Kitasatospora sp. NPDC101183]|uniref:hypothetical protein n=1 Tax=Kitasatospora sp. NPDC101183 TaxID=3364100 RepID=UPI0037F1ED9F
MPTRQLHEEQPPTTTATEVSWDTSRDPVLLGDVLFQTLADLARRAPSPPLPPQRSRPHP